MEQVKYIRYEIENIQPLRIADDSTSQSGQTSTLKYIPGTTIRGCVINQLCRDPEFENKKKILFSDHVRFMNCGIKRDGAELLPPLKGFYEDKKPANENGEKNIQNVTIDGNFSDGMKRASLGSACRVEDNKLYYYHVDTGSDMKIRIKLKDKKDKQNVFRSEYIMPGSTFVGYIAIDEPVYSVIKTISSALGEKGDYIVLGNARTSGMGLCKVLSVEEIPAESYCRAAALPQKPLEGEIYMILLSNTVMRDALGRYCGLNLTELEKKFDVSELRIVQCSTSVVNVRGYNSHLHLKAPSVTMYERGSVFHLSFKGSIAPEKLQGVVVQGIGVRRNEGFGQVIFAETSVYEKINTKKEVSSAEVVMPEGLDVKDDSETCRVIAGNYLRRRIKQYFNAQVVAQADKYARGASESQKGSVRALLLENRYDFNKAKESVAAYFGHAQEKRKKQKIHKKTAETSMLERSVNQALGIGIKEIIPDDSVMGYPISLLISDKDFGRMKIDYLLALMEYDNRKKAAE